MAWWNGVGGWDAMRLTDPSSLYLSSTLTTLVLDGNKGITAPLKKIQAKLKQAHA